MTALATTTNARSRQEWAEIIGADWRQSLESIIKTGSDLLSAKDELPHGEFKAMIENDLPFCYRTAANLMGIARHPRIANVNNSALLPPRLSVLIELSQLDEDQFADAQAKGLITPDLKVKPARAIAGAYNKPEGEVIGGAKHMLPSPKEALAIARATGRMVAADNARIYTPASDEESAEYATRRDRSFEVLRAINTLAEQQDAAVWFKAAERHWLNDFRYSALDDAIEWLVSLKEAMGVVDA